MRKRGNKFGFELSTKYKIGLFVLLTVVVFFSIGLAYYYTPNPSQPSPPSPPKPSTPSPPSPPSPQPDIKRRDLPPTPAPPVDEYTINNNSISPINIIYSVNIPYVITRITYTPEYFKVTSQLDSTPGLKRISSTSAPTFNIENNKYILNYSKAIVINSDDTVTSYDLSPSVISALSNTYKNYIIVNNSKKNILLSVYDIIQSGITTKVTSIILGPIVIVNGIYNVFNVENKDLKTLTVYVDNSLEFT